MNARSYSTRIGQTESPFREEDFDARRRLEAILAAKRGRIEPSLADRGLIEIVLQDQRAPTPGTPARRPPQPILSDPNAPAAEPVADKLRRLATPTNLAIAGLGIAAITLLVTMQQGKR